MTKSWAIPLFSGNMEGKFLARVNENEQLVF